jgi:predicted neutral ceramidase superfamily lipid hydrolase
MNKHKAIRFFIVLTVLFMQITFLTMIVKEQYKLDNFAAIFLILLLSLTLLFGISIWTYIMKNMYMKNLQ